MLPGTYTARLEAAGQVMDTEVEVRLDPRVTISRPDLMARQEAMMSAYHLAKPVCEAGQAVQRLTRQLTDAKALLEGLDDAPQALMDDVDTLQAEVRELGREINQVAGGARGAGSIESSTTRPTADQLWQIDQAWEKVPGLITTLNQIITDRMPALNRRLDEEGIRPDPGEAVAVPRRSGGR